MATESHGAVIELLKDLPEELRAELRPLPFPGWVEPMPVRKGRPSGKGWVFEPHFRGERCLIFKNRNQLSFCATDRTLLNSRTPALVDAIRRQRLRDAVMEGVIVDTSRGSMLYLLDLPYLAGHTLVRLPLTARKALLRRSIDFKGPVRFLAHREDRAEARRQASGRETCDGLLARRAEGRYEPGAVRDWIFIHG